MARTKKSGDSRPQGPTIGVLASPSAIARAIRIDRLVQQTLKLRADSKSRRAVEVDEDDEESGPDLVTLFQDGGR